MRVRCQVILQSVAVTVSEKEMQDLGELVKNMSLSETLDHDPMSWRGVRKARDELRKSYRARDELLMSAGLAQGKTITMDKILVNVCLLLSEEAKKAFERSSFSSHYDRDRCEYLFSKILHSRYDSSSSFLSLEEVFKAKQAGEIDPHKVMASGGAGCGKSVCFTRKAPYDWAIGELWQQFALLFCLELRDKSVWQAETPADLLKLARLGLSPEEQEEVRQFITDHPDKVVIVCDGLDEGSVDEFKGSLMWSLLQGKCVGIPASLRLVVTTLLVRAVQPVRCCRAPATEGWRSSGSRRKTLKFSSASTSATKTAMKLLSLLDTEQPPIASVMHVPLFCLLVCDLFQEDQELTSRRTDIFRKIVVALLHRYAKDRDVKAPFQSWATAPASLKELVTGLGRVAFRGLQEKQLYFTEVEMSAAGMPVASSGAWPSGGVEEHQFLEGGWVHLLSPDTSRVSRCRVRVQRRSADRSRHGQAAGEASFSWRSSDNVLDFSSRFAGRPWGRSAPRSSSAGHTWRASTPEHHAEPKGSALPLLCRKRLSREKALHQTVSPKNAWTCIRETFSSPRCPYPTVQRSALCCKLTLKLNAYTRWTLPGATCMMLAFFGCFQAFSAASPSSRLSFHTMICHRSTCQPWAVSSLTMPAHWKSSACRSTAWETKPWRSSSLVSSGAGSWRSCGWCR